MPKQEPGVRPARARPYELFVRATNDGSNGKLTMEFVNTCKAGATFLVYAPTSSDAPRTYTVEAGKRLKDTLTVNANGAYDFSVHGPNGFLRRFAGKVSQQQHGHGNGENAEPEVFDGYDVANGNIQLKPLNLSSAPCEFTVANAYDSHGPVQKTVRGGDSENLYLDLRPVYGWYDLTITVDSDSTFVRRIAGGTWKPAALA